MDKFDWHKDKITDNTLITKSYKGSQNVRRYFKEKCGDHFKFDRDFILWMKDDAQGLTMGDATQKWLSRQQ